MGVDEKIRARRLLLLNMGRLPADEGLFSKRTPTVMAKGAQAVDHPMAGNEVADLIPADGRSNGPLRARKARLSRYLRVGDKVSCRNGHQRLPYLELKVGSAKMKMKSALRR